jgi:hypothetical protein
MPAKAGIQLVDRVSVIPAYAGITEEDYQNENRLV